MLDAAGVSYESVPANIDERAVEDSLQTADPHEIARSLAQAKALAVSREHPGRLVLGSDSLVVVEGRRFDKPESRSDAIQHLRFFSGSDMQLVSGAALVRDGVSVWTHAQDARLAVRALSDAFIESYLEQEWPDVAGCVDVFRIEGLGVQLFDRIEGDQFTVLGMPLLAVLGALREHGELPA